MQLVDAGVVHQHIDAAEGAQHAGDEVLDGVRQDQVGGKQRMAAAGQGREGRFRRGAVPVEMDRHAHLALGQLPGDGPADAAGGPGDQRYGTKWGGHRMNSSLTMRCQLATMMTSQTAMQFR